MWGWEGQSIKLVGASSKFVKVESWNRSAKSSWTMKGGRWNTNANSGHGQCVHSISDAIMQRSHSKILSCSFKWIDSALPWDEKWQKINMLFWYWSGFINSILIYTRAHTSRELDSSAPRPSFVK